MNKKSSPLAPSHAGRRPFHLRIFLQQLVNFVVWVIVVVLVLRITLLVLGANLDAPFAEFVIQLSDYVAWPFYGLFGEARLQKTGYFDTSSLVGIIVYLLVGLGLNKLLSVTKTH